MAIPKSAAASLEALANFALDGDEASAAALAPEDMDLVRGDDGASCLHAALLVHVHTHRLHVHASAFCCLSITCRSHRMICAAWPAVLLVQARRQSSSGRLESMHRLCLVRHVRV